MTREHLQALIRQRPFIPFRIQLRDGRTYDLHYPHLLLLGLDWLTIGFPTAGDPDPEPFFETFVSVPLGWIVSMEPCDAAPHFVESEEGEP
jgi:hypothetical protein